METKEVTAAELRDRLATERQGRERLNRDCAALALRRVQGEPDAIAAAQRMRTELGTLDEEIRLLEDAIMLAEDREKRAKAAAEESETRALELQLEEGNRKRVAKRKVIAELCEQIGPAVKALAIETAAYTSLLHTVYERRRIDRTDIARLHTPHRMLGAEAASMLSENFLRQVLAEARHAAQHTEDKA